MEPWGTPALSGYSCEDFLSRTTRSRLLSKKKKNWNKAKYLTRSSIRLKFVKKTNMSNPVESLGHVKCYSSSSQRPTKSSSNSIRYNCQTICSCSRRPETILEIRKKATFHGVIKRLMKVFINGFCVNLCYVFSYFPPEGVDCSSKCKTDEADFGNFTVLLTI